MNRRVLFHRSASILWLLSLIPALLWWKESVLFVIVASIYANVASEWAAAEASDNREILERLRKMEDRLS